MVPLKISRNATLSPYCREAKALRFKSTILSRASIRICSRLVPKLVSTLGGNGANPATSGTPNPSALVAGTAPALSRPRVQTAESTLNSLPIINTCLASSFSSISSPQPLFERRRAELCVSSPPRNSSTIMTKAS